MKVIKIDTSNSRCKLLTTTESIKSNSNIDKNESESTKSNPTTNDSTKTDNKESDSANLYSITNDSSNTDKKTTDSSKTTPITSDSFKSTLSTKCPPISSVDRKWMSNISVCKRNDICVSSACNTDTSYPFSCRKPTSTRSCVNTDDCNKSDSRRSCCTCSNNTANSNCYCHCKHSGSKSNPNCSQRTSCCKNAQLKSCTCTSSGTNSRHSHCLKTNKNKKAKKSSFTSLLGKLLCRRNDLQNAASTGRRHKKPRRKHKKKKHEHKNTNCQCPNCCPQEPQNTMYQMINVGKKKTPSHHCFPPVETCCQRAFACNPYDIRCYGQTCSYPGWGPYQSCYGPCGQWYPPNYCAPVPNSCGACNLICNPCVEGCKSRTKNGKKSIEEQSKDLEKDEKEIAIDSAPLDDIKELSSEVIKIPPIKEDCENEDSKQENKVINRPISNSKKLDEQEKKKYSKFFSEIGKKKAPKNVPTPTKIPIESGLKQPKSIAPIINQQKEISVKTIKRSLMSQVSENKKSSFSLQKKIKSSTDENVSIFHGVSRDTLSYVRDKLQKIVDKSETKIESYKNELNVYDMVKECTSNLDQENNSKFHDKEWYLSKKKVEDYLLKTYQKSNQKTPCLKSSSNANNHTPTSKTILSSKTYSKHSKCENIKLVEMEIISKKEPEILSMKQISNSKILSNVLPLTEKVGQQEDLIKVESNAKIRRLTKNLNSMRLSEASLGYPKYNKSSSAETSWLYKTVPDSTSRNVKNWKFHQMFPNVPKRPDTSKELQIEN